MIDMIKNSHAGDLLVSEFLAPLGLSTADLAGRIDVVSERISLMISGKCPVDDDLDLKLTRYFRMSEGFFMRLQDDYEFLEVKRHSVD